jgi:hypothetical protein
MSFGANLGRLANLGVLPAYTGGRLVANTNDPDLLVPGLFEESRVYYVLGIARPDSAADRADEQRPIVVKVKDRDDLTVRFRRGYYAASEPAGLREADTADPVAAAVAGLLPSTDVPMRLALDPGFLADGRTSVNIMLGLDADVPAPPTAEPKPTDILVSVYDQFAKPLSSTRVAAEAVPSATSGGRVWLSHFPLPPGDYEIRIGVGERDPARQGSIYGYVDVPDPRKDRTTMGGLRIDVGGAPTLRRTFQSAEHVDGIVDVHRRVPVTRPVRLRASVIDDRGGVVWQRSLVLMPERFNVAGVATLTVDLPLGQLKEGPYLLRVSPEGQPDPDRAVRFAVK